MSKTEKIELGSTPYDESCSQTADIDYYIKAHKECACFINQLKRLYQSLFNETPDSVRLFVSRQYHDFGTYFEVAVRFDLNDKKSIETAFWFENNVPANWDEIALKELNKNDL